MGSRRAGDVPGAPARGSHACISSITPPVALAAFAAASIAQASLWPVGLHATRIGAAGFVIPFMFVNGPALMLQAG